MRFPDPLFFILIPFILGLLFIVHRRAKIPAVRFSNGQFLTGLRPTLKGILSHNLIHLRLLSSFFLLLALARPQSTIVEAKREMEGIDIVLAVDVSSSMLAEDFRMGTKRMNRIEAAKEVIKDFVSGRKEDRIGMVIFAANAYSISLLTFDHGWLLQNLERIDVGMIEDNTAIGSGLSSALNRLKESRAKKKARDPPT